MGWCGEYGQSLEFGDQVLYPIPQLIFCGFIGLFANESRQAGRLWIAYPEASAISIP